MPNPETSLTVKSVILSSCRYAKISQIFQGFKSIDLLQIYAFFMTYFDCRYIAAIFLLGYFMNIKLLEMQKPDSDHLMGLTVLGIRC